jgi:glycerol-3-phosphate dehydrogenase (NAD(P)+)
MLASKAGNEAVLWTRDAAVVTDLNEQHRNSAYHPDLTLSEAVTATTDVRHALSEAEFIVLSVPAQTLRSNLAQWTDSFSSDAIVVSLLKGVEVGTHLRMSEVIHEVTGAPAEKIAVVSGPNLASEIASGQPAATTVACVDESVAEMVQRMCGGPTFRPYTTTDVIGTEIGGAAKNIVAVAAGIGIGMGFGENAQAALITRGLAEIARLGVALGADPMTFSGLAGMGDLVATCGSQLSRNRTFGVNIGRGMSVTDAITATKGTCEGFETSRAVLALGNDHGVDLPITRQVVEVLHHGASAKEMLAKLMARDMKSEVWA